MLPQPSRKLQYIDGDDGQVAGARQQETISALPQQIAPKNLFDPTNFFQDYHTGNSNVQAYWKVPCVRGGVRRPCFWIPITCMQFNQGTYNSWMETLWDGFAQTSIKRTMVIKKNGDRSSPLLQRYVKSGIGIRKMVVVFVRKIPCPEGQQDPVPGFGDDGDFEDSTDFGAGGPGGGGGRRGCRRRCRDKSCHGRCDRCRRGGDADFSGDSVSEWERFFPWRQQTIVFTLFCSRISAGMMYAGEQCRSKPTGCATACNSYPGALDPVTWLGGPGLAGVGPEWQVIGQGPNFSERPQWHGLGPLAQEQYQIMWSSAKIQVELRNPVNGCVYWRESQMIPI